MRKENEALSLLTKRPVEESQVFSRRSGELLRALESNEKEVRLAGIERLEALTRSYIYDLRIVSKSVALLFAALSDGEAFVRSRALRALTSIAVEFAPESIYFKGQYVDILMNMLHEDDPAILALVLDFIQKARIARVEDLRRICEIREKFVEKERRQQVEELLFHIGKCNVNIVVLLASQKKDLPESLLGGAGAVSWKPASALVPFTQRSQWVPGAALTDSYHEPGDWICSTKNSNTNSKSVHALVDAVWNPHLYRLFSRGLYKEVLEQLKSVARFVDRESLFFAVIRCIQLNALLCQNPAKMADIQKRKAQVVLKFPDLSVEVKGRLLNDVGFIKKPDLCVATLATSRRIAVEVTATKRTKPLIEGYPHRINATFAVKNVADPTKLSYALVILSMASVDKIKIIHINSVKPSPDGQLLKFSVAVSQTEIDVEIYLCLVDTEGSALCRLSRLSTS